MPPAFYGFDGPPAGAGCDHIGGGLACHWNDPTGCMCGPCLAVYENSPKLREAATLFFWRAA